MKETFSFFLPIFIPSGVGVSTLNLSSHMLDEHGLIELLTNAGYTVERFDYEA